MATDRQRRVLGQRLRAAIVLSGKESREVRPEIMKALEVSDRTVGRLIAGTKTKALNDDDYDKTVATLAKTLKVPEWFLRDGFEGANGQPAPAGTPVLDAILGLIGTIETLRQSIDDGTKSTLAMIDARTEGLGVAIQDLRALVRERVVDPASTLQAVTAALAQQSADLDALLQRLDQQEPPRAEEDQGP